MKALKTSFNGNPNVGSLLFVNNKFGIISPRYFKKYKRDLEETFSVPFYSLTISGTDLLGIFIAGNDDFMIIPEIAFKEEIEMLKEICKKHETGIIISNDKATALGNLILMNKNSIILSQEVNEKTVKQILEKTKLKGVHLSQDLLIGSLARINNQKGIVSPLIDEEQTSLIQETLKIETVQMTTNFGNNFISSGIALNDSGYIVGNLCSPVELYEIDQFLRE